MALTPFRWIVAAVAGCLMVGVVLMRTDRPFMRDRGAEQQLARRAERLAGHASITADRLRLVQLNDSVNAVLPQPGNPLSVRVLLDAALPSGYATVLDSAGWRALAPVRDSGHVGIDIVFLFDTVTRVRGAPVRGSWSPRSDYVLPRNASERCRAIIHIPAPSQFRRNALAEWRSVAAAERIGGPCLYYRAFGMPGTQVGTWLITRGWAFAEGGSWNQASTQVNLAKDQGWLYDIPTQAILGLNTSLPFLYSMSLDGVRCVAARVDACDRGLLDTERYGPRLVNGNILDHRYLSWEREGWNNRGLGRREWLLLADMVRTLGRERFGRFWTSNLPVPAAFESASDEPVGAWTSRWAVSQYGPLPGMGPGVSRSAGAMSLMFIVLAVLVTLRAGARRQFA